MAFGSIGQTFAPTNQAMGPNGTPRQGQPTVQDAIRLLSLNLPRNVGAGAPVAPQLLGNGQGSPLGSQLTNALMLQWLRQLLGGGGTATGSPSDTGSNGFLPGDIFGAPPRPTETPGTISTMPMPKTLPPYPGGTTIPGPTYPGGKVDAGPLENPLTKPTPMATNPTVTFGGGDNNRTQPWDITPTPQPPPMDYGFGGGAGGPENQMI